MSPLITNPLSVVMSLTALLGVFVHDVQAGNVTALSTAAIVADYRTETVDLLKTGQHYQAEVNSFLESTHNAGSQPSTQPRNENDKKYIAKKRLYSTYT